MKTPMVTVIMAVYNQDAFLKASIESVLSQTMKEWELIIIDDRSTDGSLKTILKYAKSDKRIKVLRNSKNMGAAETRNRGLSRARGKYVAIQDSDDNSYPTRLEKELKYLESHPDIFLVGSYATGISSKGTRFRIDSICGKENNLRKIVRRNHIIHSSVMFRNSREFQYRTKFRFAQDYDFMLNVISKGYGIDNIPEALVEYRVNDEGISSTKSEKQAFLAEKAKEFYWQRRKTGKDSYDKFDPENEMKARGIKDGKGSYNGLKTIINLAVYTDKKVALKLILQNLGKLEPSYVLKKTALLMMPASISRLIRNR
ncbi:glycosyltransferase [Candidatus Woesearchaeota archaeon]|nr:glycosyltransferase [Candidatus Woesearchaeota archaeon]